MYTFTTLTSAIQDIADHLKNELMSIRTSQAAPALLDNVHVEAYGSMMPLNQVGSVTIEDSRTLRVSAWDIAQVHALEKAIRNAELGVSVSADEKGVRVSFPELTSDRRTQLLKLTRTKLEEARTAIRQVREHTWQDIQKKEKEKELSEDDKFRAKEGMEKLVKEGNDKLEEMAVRKEEELQS
ncbi:MAG: ribosome recycling factor [Candidatus Pacebacteria bacterium]|nr:ribosome recycling factor [Candidatus Paceibacterota bacterium]